MLTKYKTFKILLFTLPILAIGVGSYLYYTSHYVSSDNAYVNADIIEMSAQVMGPVSKVYVKNNDFVKKGDLLFEIDPAPFKLKVIQAEANLKLTEQSIKEDEQEVLSAQSLIIQKTAEYNNAKSTLERAKLLVDKKFLSPETLDNNEAAFKAAEAELEIAKIKLVQAEILTQDKARNNAKWLQAKAMLDAAQLDLNYTKIGAPEDGQITN
ncbi:MAG: secretion protein HlyD family protein, partial [Francisellaceae bacterium]|nr:secretion protein HlyD family protein [Francisellaceae bacterium]